MKWINVFKGNPLKALFQCYEACGFSREEKNDCSSFVNIAFLSAHKLSAVLRCMCLVFFPFFLKKKNLCLQSSKTKSSWTTRLPRYVCFCRQHELYSCSNRSLVSLFMCRLLLRLQKAQLDRNVPNLFHFVATHVFIFVVICCILSADI